MRRERRKYEEKDNFKTILILAGGGLVLAIITFIVVFTMYSNKLNSDKIGGVDVSKLPNINGVNGNAEGNTIKSASSDMGKTVNEVKAQDNAIANQNNIVNQGNNVNTASNANNTNNTVNNTGTNTNKNSQTPTTPPKVEEKEPEFQMPIEGEVSREYAKDTLIYSDTLQEWVTHLGIDINAPKTTVVKAASNGTVESIKNDPRYGLTIIIKHSKGYKTIYSNLLSTEFVKVGEKVKSGQSIGTVGNSAAFEIADEPHLHFEIVKDDVKVNPSVYLK